MISEFISLIPRSVMDRSGAVFNTGRAGFSSPSPVYLLGINPGGDPDEHKLDTVAAQVEKVLRAHPTKWSGFADVSWNGHPPGTFRMQPRILHFMTSLGLDVRGVPASNLVFARSTRQQTFDGDLAELARETWPFHQAVIDRLRVRIVACMGKTAGRFVRDMLGAHDLVDTFVEDNNRRWQSTLHRQPGGIYVATLSHPSMADWRARASDPTPLVGRALRP